ncbi:MAG TPA: hypothetical protein GXZ90_01580 [Clostridiales bacterium]|nr:hypothetical protein [Clostridiales bacterium]
MKRLFIEGKDPTTYAYFGWAHEFGMDTEFYGYVEGYKEAGDILVENAIGADLADNKIRDTLIFPILFSYRQFLELRVKMNYIKFSLEDNSSKKEFINKTSHDLKRAWDDYVKPLVLEDAKLINMMDEINQLQSYIYEFNDLDPDGFRFRYPINKKLDSLNKDWEYLDLVNLKHRMNEMYDLMEDIEYMLAH